jgi:type I restriction enzyme M protein
MAKISKPSINGRANFGFGFDAELWVAAHKLRNRIAAAEYKHRVLGLIPLRYISDIFEDRKRVIAGKGDYAAANVEHQEGHKAENVFWVPRKSRWSHVQANAKQPTFGKIVGNAMVPIGA